MGSGNFARVLFIGLVFGFSCTTEVVAKLGEAEASIESDAKILGCKKESVIGHKNFQVIQLDCDWGKLREFVSMNAGKSNDVFALAWNGIAHPDFQNLLGIYFKENKEPIEKGLGAGRSHQQKIRTNSLVFEKWGHLKNLGGRAYDPTLLPTGMKADEIL